MAKTTTQLDQGQLLERLERLERQLAQSRVRPAGGGLRMFLFGALVGGGLALLYAPQQGEQSRERVLQWKDRAVELAGQAQEQATRVAGQVQQATDTRADLA